MRFVPCFQFIFYNPHINSLVHLSTDISESFRIKKVRLNTPSRQDSTSANFPVERSNLRLTSVGFWEGNMIFPSPKLLAPQGVLLVKPFCSCLSGWLSGRWFFKILLSYYCFFMSLLTLGLSLHIPNLINSVYHILCHFTKSQQGLKRLPACT